MRESLKLKERILLVEQRRERERERERDEAAGMVVDVGGFTSNGVSLVRLLRYMGPSTRCFLQHHHD
ncbi:unnamed protein product [Camellia sinensis]